MVAKEKASWPDRVEPTRSTSALSFGEKSSRDFQRSLTQRRIENIADQDHLVCSGGML
jgi:hypothetical protein